MDRGELIVRIRLAHIGEELYLEGVKPCTTVAELYNLIQTQNGIHSSRQRLYIGGDEMEENKSLLDYFSTSHDAQICTLVLRCFIPLLLSTLNCPGPMLAEIEVSPRNDEPIITVKRRIRDKFRIEIANQRIHVHPSEMTTFTLRRPLDDARLLSAYLSPGCGGNFLELVVVNKPEQTRYNETNKEIYVRLPRNVVNSSKFIEANKLQFSSHIQCRSSIYSPEHPDPTNLKAENLPPPPPPQTPETALATSGAPSPDSHLNDPERNMQPWWVMLPIQIDKIIKRDPKFEDILKIFAQSIQLDEDISSKKSRLCLKYCNAKISYGGKQLNKDEFIYKDLLMRREEMLLYVASPGLEGNLNKLPAYFFGLNENVSTDAKPSVPYLCPIEPLSSYDDHGILYTTPSDPFYLSWAIDSGGVTDCGATPQVVLELTGLSYSRKYGSWDIPEHFKTYVELVLEGSFEVGDHGYKALLGQESSKGFENLDHDREMLAVRNISNDHEEYAKKIVYYVQDAMEIIIYGPFNISSLLNSGSLGRSKPFGSSTKEFVNERQKIFDFQQEIRRGEFKNPPMPRPAPFYKRIDDRHLHKTTPLSNDITQSWEGRRQLSKNVIGQWCLSRERISDVTVGSNQSSARVFASRCTRGVAKDGRAFCKINYERRIPVKSTVDTIFPRSQLIDCFRNSLDFRIQTQFYISHLADDPADMGDTADFKIEFRHWVTRIDHELYSPDDCAQYESPNVGMDVGFKVGLANRKWLESSGLEQLPTIELQKVSSWFRKLEFFLLGASIRLFCPRPVS